MLQFLWLNFSEFFFLMNVSTLFFSNGKRGRIGKIQSKCVCKKEVALEQWEWMLNQKSYEQIQKQYENVAHIKFSSKGGQNTHISLVYLAHIAYMSAAQETQTLNTNAL